MCISCRRYARFLIIWKTFFVQCSYACAALHLHAWQRPYRSLPVCAPRLAMLTLMDTVLAIQVRLAGFTASWLLTATLEYIPVVRNSVGFAPKWRRKTLAK